MNIQNISDAAFKKYGRVLNEYDSSELIKEMAHTPLPKEEVIYVPSVEELELLPAAKEFRDRGFGGIPIQIGYCNGNNTLLNAVEYHRSSEINIAVTDIVLLLGMQQDIEADYTYHTANIEAFLIPAGTAVELYATTLHYAPCNSSEGGFRCVVILPRATNTELEAIPLKQGEDALLFARNKWLISHQDAQIENSFTGLKGNNINIKE